MPIKILSDKVASQIAAGEVIERPASVVKELLENSLDAGAKQVIIHIQKAGKMMVEVADDGSGIPLEEMKLAVSRHATSKLSTAKDLEKISTLGFRGEALASVASVSHLVLTSKTGSADIGGRLVVDGGVAGKLEKIGMPSGTTIQVGDLFYNVPARLKFLKTDSTEKRRIDELVTRYALAYSHVKIHLFHNGKPALQTSGSGDRREVLANIYGVDTAKQMIQVQFDEDDFHISGFISPISLTRSTRKEITFFVNGRWVQDPALTSALLRAYQTYLMVGRYPISMLFVDLPPEMVDVNVHPTKAEIRFQDSGAVFSRVQRAVRRALMAYSPVPQIPGRLWHPRPEQRTIDPVWDMAADTATAIDIQNTAAQDVDMPTQTALPSASQIPILRLIGQVGATYLVAEGPDGLYLIDQHSAHERVLYEKLTGKKGETLASQKLLDPAVVQLTPSQADILEEHLPTLNKIGIEIEPFGPATFQIRAIPAELIRVNPGEIVQVIVEDFEEDESPLQNELEKKVIARICKRSAVKGGQILSRQEQEKLLFDLEACESPRTCPHGRPTMIHLSVNLLERQFGRRGSR